MKSKSRILLISTIIIFILTIFIGTSYSLWQTINTQDSVNTATTKCFNVEITSQKNSISLENAYPITNEKGKKLTPFSFTITNTCDIFASYSVSLESLKGTTLASKFLNAMINNEEIKKLSDYEITDTVNDGSIESHILAKGSLGSGDSEDYTLRVWIDYDTTMEDLDNETKTFKSKIIVKAEPSSWNPVDEGYTSLHDAILANEYQSSPEKAISKIESKGTPDLSKTAPLIEWKSNIDDSTSTIEIIKFSEETIGIDEMTSKLNIYDTKLNIADSYEFSSQNGDFIEKNIRNVDPTELDYSNNNFYIIHEQITTRDIDGITYYWTYSPQSSNYCYKILQATKEKISNLYGKYSAIKYKLTVQKLYSSENELDKSDKGLYKDTDDYGIAYYFRGNVNNNNVFFGGFYWQIIRINGDGSIRLIYNGTEKNSKNDKKSIGTSAYNTIGDSPAYVGYMYGKKIDSRNDSIKNEVDSTIKIKLDSWYKNNLIKYNDYISNNGFCNDRTLTYGDGYSSNKLSSFWGQYDDNVSSKCKNQSNDLFTTSDSEIGNKSLIYPIGLITADELVLSGMKKRQINKFAWTYTDIAYFTMTPSQFDHNYTVSDVWALNKYLHGYMTVGSELYVRPVISLKSDVKISGGIGTINDPFVVKTE